jgi:hypothetical protein
MISLTDSEPGRLKAGLVGTAAPGPKTPRPQLRPSRAAKNEFLKMLIAIFRCDSSRCLLEDPFFADNHVQIKLLLILKGMSNPNTLLFYSEMKE